LKEFVQVLDLHDDPAVFAQYESHHRRVWPEVLDALREAGIESMRLFRCGPRLVMIGAASDDFDPRGYAEYARSSPRLIEWETLMRTLQRPLPFAEAGSWWMPATEIFRWNASDASP